MRVLLLQPYDCFNYLYETVTYAIDLKVTAAGLLFVEKQVNDES